MPPDAIYLCRHAICRRRGADVCVAVLIGEFHRCFRCRRCLICGAAPLYAKRRCMIALYTLELLRVDARARYSSMFKRRREKMPRAHPSALPMHAHVTLMPMRTICSFAAARLLRRDKRCLLLFCCRLCQQHAVYSAALSPTLDGARQDVSFLSSLLFYACRHALMLLLD